jgi:2-polyprenyl-3-methyl-5-hydroxy-6-metoxy-1,4-benzoquinol methylase
MTYTHGHHESVLRSHRWRTVENSAGYLLPALRPGTRVLDVGCGPGTITLDIAQRVAPGVVVGVDSAAAIVDDARTNATDAAMPNLTFEVGDVYALPYDDGSFDVVHAHQVLQHLADPVAALPKSRVACSITSTAASMPIVSPGATRAAMSAVMLPGPQPTSSTRTPAVRRGMR